MDALKAEIAQKRKAADTSTNGRPQKYMRKGDLERLKEEQERKAREEKEAQERAERERIEREAAEKSQAKVSLTPHRLRCPRLIYDWRTGCCTYCFWLSLNLDTCIQIPPAW